MCFWKHLEARNKQCSDRILIHIWSALPGFTVWSEFRFPLMRLARRCSSWLEIRLNGRGTRPNLLSKLNMPLREIWNYFQANSGVYNEDVKLISNTRFEKAWVVLLLKIDRNKKYPCAVGYNIVAAAHVNNKCKYVYLLCGFTKTHLHTKRIIRDKRIAAKMQIIIVS